MSLSPPPIPVQPLSYASEYVDTRRPGIIIALGVLSIIFSITFGISAIFALLMAIGAAAGPTARASVPAASIVPSWPDGIGSGPRAIVLAHISSVHALSQTRQDVLDGFLAQQGEQIDSRLRRLEDPHLVPKIITQIGKSDEGFDYVHFTRGKLTLEDTKAIYEPWGTTDLITVDFASADPKPGMVNFDPTGGIGPSGTTTVATTTRLVISNTSIVLQTVTGVLCGILAALLLVAGVFTVRARPAGRTLHLWWAWLKIVVSLFGAVATYIFWREFIGQTAAASGQPNVATTALSTGIVMSLMGLGLAVLYPIAVLIVMHLRSVRNYLSSVT
jgi:hypothetical protein